MMKSTAIFTGGSDMGLVISSTPEAEAYQIEIIGLENNGKAMVKEIIARYGSTAGFHHVVLPEAKAMKDFAAGTLKNPNP